MVSVNQTETLSCSGKQFPNKTTRYILKFKGADGVIHRVSFGGCKNPVQAKPSNPVSSAKPTPEISLQQQKMHLSDHKTKVAVKTSTPVKSIMRRPETPLDCIKWKREKMDCNFKLDCISAVKTAPKKIPNKRTDAIRHRVDVGGSKHHESKVPAKPSNPVSSRKRRPELGISLGSQKSKKQKMDISEDKPRDRVFVCGSKRVKPSKPVERRSEMPLDYEKRKREKMDCNLKLECSKNFAHCSSKQVKPENLNNDKVGSRVDAEMSPEKALRVAMLKSRFSDTIFKATHSALLDHDEKSSFSKMQRQREQLVKEQIQEKAMVEAEVVALHRATERMTLEKMSQTVDLNNYVSLPGAPMGYPNFSLMRLGLRMKDD